MTVTSSTSPSSSRPVYAIGVCSVVNRKRAIRTPGPRPAGTEKPSELSPPFMGATVRICSLASAQLPFPLKSIQADRKPGTEHCASSEAP